MRPPIRPGGSQVYWIVACLALVLPAQALAQAGVLDTSFSGDGRVVTEFTPRFDAAVDVAAQSDGKLVAAGWAFGQGYRFALARYDADGTLDPTFSGDGKATTNFTSGVDFALDVALQSDGKIVLVGRAGGQGGRFAVARYNADGTLDATFSGDGRAMTNFTPGDDVAYDVVVQADGKIVAGGQAAGKGGRLALARYNVDGTLDASFSGDGRTMTNFTAGVDYVDALAVQADGKIVAAGTSNWNRPGSRIALARYNDNGTLDASFSGDGRLATNFTTPFDGAFGVAVQPGDQRIVAVGQAGRRFVVLRYGPGGALDPTFSGNGSVTTRFSAGWDYAEDVELQADGKIVVAGSANYFGQTTFAVARYEANGSLDTTFSGDGKTTTNFGAGRDSAYGLALQPADGKIVVAGDAGGARRFALARYHAS